MTKNRTPTPVYLDPGMHPGLEVKGLKQFSSKQLLNKNKNIYWVKPFSFLQYDYIIKKKFRGAQSKYEHNNK